MSTDFKDKKVLIFGLGVNQGGLGSAKFFIKQGAKVKITDLKNKEQLKSSLDELKQFPEIEYTLGEHKNEDIDWADLVIKNPGVKPGNQYIDYALKQGKQVEMDMGIFLEFVKPEQVIGVTGTKGKSTTASLVFEALKAGGKKVVFAGNIGKSVLDTIDQVDQSTLVVLEISSFQLEAWDQHQVSPHWAVITNIMRDHLNYHATMEEYIDAKRVIAKYQTDLDFLFLQYGDSVTTTEQFQYELQGQIDYFSVNDLPSDFELSILGEHNKLNAAAALSVANTLNIPEDVTLEAMKNFKGVEFRMQLTKDWQGIKIYNDTASTTPDSAIAALKALPNSILITGGMDKNLLFEEYAKIIENLAKAVYFIDGEATQKISQLITNKSLIKGVYQDLESLLADVKDAAKPGDIILFSPGATSFNFFQNEWDRGRKFNAAVEKIFS